MATTSKTKNKAMHIDTFLEAAERLRPLEEIVKFEEKLTITKPDNALAENRLYKLDFSGQRVELTVDNEGYITDRNANPGLFKSLASKFTDHDRLLLSQLGFYGRFLLAKPEEDKSNPANNLRSAELEVAFMTLWDQDLQPKWVCFPSFWFFFYNGSEAFPMFNLEKAVRIDHPQNKIWFDDYADVTHLMTGDAHSVMDRIFDKFAEFPELQEKNELPSEDITELIRCATDVKEKNALTSMTLFDHREFYDLGY